MIATAQLDLADLAVLCAWLPASSIQSQSPTVGAWSTTEDGAWVLVGGAEGGNSQYLATHICAGGGIDVWAVASTALVNVLH